MNKLGRGEELTVGVLDVVNLLEGETVRATFELDDVGDGFQGGEAGGWRCRCFVLSDGQDSGVCVLGFDLEDTVLL